MSNCVYVLVVLFSVTTMFAADEAAQKSFEELKKKNWQESFSDTCTKNWQTKWFLDGIHAKVTNNSEAMTIDTSKGYAVLWTKPEFEGDVRIEYEFKRVDDFQKQGVNIIYIQATGDGQNGCDEDISKWSEKRKLAAMKNYFLNMHTYHISYATADTKSPRSDYIRGRRYMPIENKGLKGTKLAGEYFKKGLFKDKKWVRITIIKKDKKIWMEIKHPDKTQLCFFENKDKPGIDKGRIGLRLMPNRLSQFKNFKVYTSGK